MKRLLTLLALLCCASIHAATVTITLTNFYAAPMDSNTVLQLFYTNQPMLNGNVFQVGQPIRVSAPYGSVSTNLLPGNYSLNVVGQTWQSPLRFTVGTNASYNLSECVSNASTVVAYSPYVTSITNDDGTITVTPSTGRGMVTIRAIGGGGTNAVSTNTVWLAPYSYVDSQIAAISGPTNGISNTAATNLARATLNAAYTRRAANPKPWNGVLSWYVSGVNSASYNWLTNQMAIAERCGWLQAGYNMLLIDGGWSASRDGNGNIVENASRWPVSISNAVIEAHSRGFKVGLYTEPTALIAAGVPGSLGYLEQDAATYANWGIDLIKFDVFGSTNREQHVAQFSAALDAVNWKGHLHVGLGAIEYAPWVSKYADSWRSSYPGRVDMEYSTVHAAKFGALMNWDNMSRFPQSVESGRYINLDSIPSWFAGSAGGDKNMQWMATLWAMAGGGVMQHSFRDSVGDANYSAAFTNLTGNAFDVANTPGLGYLIQSANVPVVPPNWGANGGYQIYQKRLSGAKTAIALINRDTNNPVTITLNWTNAGLKNGTSAVFTDLFSGASGTSNAFVRTLAAYNSELWMIEPSTIPTILDVRTTATLSSYPWTNAPLTINNTNAGTVTLGMVITNSALGSSIRMGSSLSGTWNGIMFSSPQDNANPMAYQWCNILGGTNETILNIPQYASSGRITLRDAGSTILGTINTAGAYLNLSGSTNLPRSGVTGLETALDYLTNANSGAGITASTGTNIAAYQAQIATNALANANTNLWQPLGALTNEFKAIRISSTGFNPVTLFHGADNELVIDSELTANGSLTASGFKGGAAWSVQRGSSTLTNVANGSGANLWNTHVDGANVSNAVATATAANNSTNFWGQLDVTNLPPTITRPIATLGTITNALASVAVTTAKSLYITNLAGNITLTGPTFQTTSNAESVRIMFLANGADRSVTIPTSWRTPDGARTYYMTNGAAGYISVEGLQNVYTNAAYIKLW